MFYFSVSQLQMYFCYICTLFQSFLESIKTGLVVGWFCCAMYTSFFYIIVFYQGYSTYGSVYSTFNSGTLLLFVYSNLQIFCNCLVYVMIFRILFGLVKQLIEDVFFTIPQPKKMILSCFQFSVVFCTFLLILVICHSFLIASFSILEPFIPLPFISLNYFKTYPFYLLGTFFSTASLGYLYRKSQLFY